MYKCVVIPTHDGLFVQLIPFLRDLELDLPPTYPGGYVPHHQAHNLFAHISL